MGFVPAATKVSSGSLTAASRSPIFDWLFSQYDGVPIHLVILEIVEACDVIASFCFLHRDFFLSQNFSPPTRNTVFSLSFFFALYKIFKILDFNLFIKFQLDIVRDAVAVQVRLKYEDGSVDSKSSELTSNEDLQQHQRHINQDHLLWIYGTHLEDCDDLSGNMRLAEIKTMIERIGFQTNH